MVPHCERMKEPIASRQCPTDKESQARLKQCGEYKACRLYNASVVPDSSRPGSVEHCCCCFLLLVFPPPFFWFPFLCFFPNYSLVTHLCCPSLINSCNDSLINSAFSFFSIEFDCFPLLPGSSSSPVFSPYFLLFLLSYQQF